MKLEMTVISEDKEVFKETYDSFMNAVDGVNEYYKSVSGKARYGLDKTLFELFSYDIYKDAMRGHGVKITGNLINSHTSLINVKLHIEIFGEDVKAQRVCAVIVNDNYQPVLDAAMFRNMHIVHDVKCTNLDAFEKVKQYILEKQYLYNVMDFDASLVTLLINDRNEIPNIDEIEKLAIKHGTLITYVKQYTKGFDYELRYTVPNDLKQPLTDAEKFVEAFKQSQE